MRNTNLFQFIGKILINGSLSGTGFVINSQEAIIATAKHNIGSFNLDSISFVLPSCPNPYHIDEVIFSSPENEEDIVLLKLSENLPKSIEVPDLIASIPPAGSSFLITGFDQDINAQYEFRSATGSISGMTGKGNRIFLQVVSSFIWRGMSGSPVLTSDQKGIIGILIEKGKKGKDLEGQAIIVPTFVLETFDKRIQSTRQKYLTDLIGELSPRQNDILDLGHFIDPPIEFKTTNDPNESGQEYDGINKLSSLPQKFIVTGEAGSGKSTLLKWLALADAKNALENVTRPIPVIIELWSWRNNNSSFMSFVEEIVDDHPTYKRLRLLGPIKELIEQGDVSLYLDGLDELIDENVRELNEWFENINSKVLVSCREESYIGIRRFNAPNIKILPLYNSHIALFAEKYLSTEKSEAFLNSTLIDNPNHYDNLEHIVHLAKIPFFLILMLARYKNDPLGETPSQWNLLEGVIKQLWEQKRVQDLITKFNLDEFSRTDKITNLLSQVAYENVGMTWIHERKTFRLVPNKLIEVLEEAGIIRKDYFDFRFRHPLIADYLAALTLLHKEDLKQYADSEYTWSRVLVVLASYSDKKREEVQAAFLEELKDLEKVSDYSRRGLLWALGEIGDHYALNKLLDLFNKPNLDKREKLLTPIGRIGKRLPESKREKRLATEALKAHLDNLLKSPDIDSIDDFLKSGFDYPLSIWTAVDGISELGSVEAANIIMACLKEVAKRVPPQTRHSMRHPVLQSLLHDGFESAFLRIGKNALPALLDGIKNDNFEVSSISARSIAHIRAPLPIEPLLSALIMSSSALAKFHIALALGKANDPDAIFYLMSTLNDKDTWQQGNGMVPIENVTWRRFYYERPFLIIPTYYRVDDAAAYALAQINTPEIRTVLSERLYDLKGNPTLELKLERLRNDNDLDITYPLRNQEAKYLAFNKGNYPLLFSLMGHLKIGLYRNDPIASSLILRADLAKEKPLDELCNFIEGSTDIVSRAWAFYVLGSIGNRNLLPFIKDYLYCDNPELVSASACALGILIALDETISSEDPEELVYYEKLLIDLLPKASHEVYPGIGVGLAFLCDKDESFFTLLSSELSTLIYGNDKNITKLVVDILDLVFLTLVSGSSIQVQILPYEDDLINEVEGLSSEESIRELILQNPSLLRKLGDLNYEIGEYGNPKRLRCAIDWYQKCLDKRSDPPDWGESFTEQDWSDLHCDHFIIHLKLSMSYCLSHDLEQCVQHYQKAVDVIDSYPFLIEKYSSEFLECCLKAGIGSFNLGNFNQAIEILSKAVDLADQLGDIKGKVNALMGIQAGFREKEEWQQVLEVGERVLRLDSHSLYFEKCMAHFNRGVAFDELGEKSKSISELTLMIDLSTKNGMIRELTEGLMFRSALWNELENSKYFEDDVKSAFSVYEAIQAWNEAANICIDAANLSKDPTLTINFLEKALSFLGKANGDTRIEKAKVYIRLGKAADQTGNLSKGEEYYKEAITCLDEVDLSSNHASLLLFYGRNLALQGQKDRGNAFIFKAIAILQQLGEDTSEAEFVLREISDNRDWLIPSTIVEMIFNDTLEVLAFDAAMKEELFQKVNSMIDQLRGRNQSDELEFLLAIKALVENQSSSISQDNKYFEEYNKFLTSLEVLTGFRRSTNKIARGLSMYVDALNSGDSDIEQELIAQNPDLLSDECFSLIDHNIEFAEESDYKDYAGRFLRIREILSLVKDYGLANVYSVISKPFDEVIRPYLYISKLSSRNEIRDYIKSNPDILSSDSELQLNIIIRFNKLNGEPEQEGFLTFLRELISFVRERGIDEVFDNLFDDPSATGFVIDFVSSNNLKEAKRKIIRNKILLDPKIDTEFELMLRMAQSVGNVDTIESIQMYRTLLYFCRENGVELGFEYFESFAGGVGVIRKLLEVSDVDELEQILDENPYLCDKDMIQMIGNSMKLLINQNQEEEARRIFILLAKIMKYKEVKARQEILSNTDTREYAQHVLLMIDTENWDQVANLIDEMPDSSLDSIEHEFQREIEIAEQKEADLLLEKLENHYGFFKKVRIDGIKNVLEEISLRRELVEMSKQTVLSINDDTSRQQWLSKLNEHIDSTPEGSMKDYLISLKGIMLNGMESSVIQEGKKRLSGIYLDLFMETVNEIISSSDESFLELIVTKTIEVIKGEQDSKDQWIETLSDDISGISEEDKGSIETFIQLIISLLKENTRTDVIPAELAPELEPYWQRIIGALNENN